MARQIGLGISRSNPHGEDASTNCHEHLGTSKSGKGPLVLEGQGLFRAHDSGPYNSIFDSSHRIVVLRPRNL